MNSRGFVVDVIFGSRYMHMILTFHVVFLEYISIWKYSHVVL